MAVSRMASVSVVIATALVGASGWAVASMLLGDTSTEPVSFYGARLGVTASDLRRRLTPPVPGSFRAAADAPENGDLALEWVADPGLDPSSTASAPTRARFEIHAGLVVAIRATVPKSSPLAAGPSLTETRASVVSRRANADETVSLTILARDCPTHAAEVHALLRTRPR